MASKYKLNMNSGLYSVGSSQQAPKSLQSLSTTTFFKEPRYESQYLKMSQNQQLQQQQQQQQSSLKLSKSQSLNNNQLKKLPSSNNQNVQPNSIHPSKFTQYNNSSCLNNSNNYKDLNQQTGLLNQSSNSQQQNSVHFKQQSGSDIESSSHHNHQHQYSLTQSSKMQSQQYDMLKSTSNSGSNSAKHKTQTSDLTFMQSNQSQQQQQQQFQQQKSNYLENALKSKGLTQSTNNNNNSQSALSHSNQKSSKGILKTYHSINSENSPVKNKPLVREKQSSNPFFSCFTSANESQTEALIESPDTELFMVKDKDTNQVYDIRAIDQIQKFENANKKEYFDKLKKRHSSMWQNWWNQKKENNSKLLMAVRQNDIASASAMLEESLGDLKAEQNVKDDSGWTPLHFAASNGNFDMVVLLLKNDSELDSENNNAQSPLLISAQKGHVNIVQVLLNYGADINHQDMHFNTALHYACLFEKIQVIEALLQKPSIQIKLKNSDRKTAMDIANSKQAKQLFETFIQRQNQMVVNASKVTIQEVSNESMFNIFEQEQQEEENEQQEGEEENQEYEFNKLNNNKNNQKSNQNLKKNHFQLPNSSNQKAFSNSNGFNTFNGHNNSQNNNNNINCSPKKQNTYTLEINKQQQQLNQQQQQQNSQRNLLQQQSQNNKGQKLKQFTPFSTNSNTYYTSGQTTAYSSPKKAYGPERFKIVNLIGRGSFGEVYLVQDKYEDNQQFAMKVLHKSKILGQNLVKYAMTERNVLSIINHPFIVKLRFAFQNNKELFLIMDLASQGDLAKLIRNEQKLTEQRTKIYLAQILTALETLHSHDIIYRDLKPENIVIDKDGNALLTDFGLSKEGVSDHKSASSFCGSLAYLAPEMLKRQGHGKAVDWYHFGVLLYEMLTGEPPFISQDRDQIIDNIQNQQVKIPNYLSQEARSLIKQLMTKNPVHRLGSGQRDALEIKQHPFFHGIDWGLLLQKKIAPPKMTPNDPIVENRFAVPKDFEWGNSSKNDKGSINYIQGWSFIHPENNKFNLSKKDDTNDDNSKNFVGKKNNNIMTNSTINNLSNNNSDYQSKSQQQQVMLQKQLIKTNSSGSSCKASHKYNNSGGSSGNNNYQKNSSYNSNDSGSGNGFSKLSQQLNSNNNFYKNPLSKK